MVNSLPCVNCAQSKGTSLAFKPWFTSDWN